MGYKPLLIASIIFFLVVVGGFAAYQYLTPQDEPIVPIPGNNNQQNGQQPSQQRSVQLFYYNPALDEDETGNIQCSRAGLVSVERTIPATITPIQDTIELLIEGDLTVQERAQGIETEYPLDGFELEGANLQNGTLTLEFSDPNNATSGGSCRVGILWFQIEQTALQFPEVDEVRFIPEELFQP